MSRSVRRALAEEAAWADEPELPERSGAPTRAIYRPGMLNRDNSVLTGRGLPRRSDVGCTVAALEYRRQRDP